jgi:acetyltransferase-like isoleucine patch superfamily enzyme
VINLIIRKLKESDTYSVDSDLSSWDILIILNKRIFQVIRGLIIKPFLKKSKGIIFKGKNVSIEHLNKISCGKNLIVEDNVFINALSKTGISFGANVTIQRDSILICTGVIRSLGVGIAIGDNVGINSRVYLGGQGGIEIGKNVIIGPDVKIFSENHNFVNKDILIKEQGETRQGVNIGCDCWIGSGSIILDGVNLGTGCIVAAGSVVTKSFLPFSVVGGVPAKIIKMRE